MGLIDRLMTFLDSLDGGAWSHLVGAVICQVYSGNERDLGLVTSYAAYRDNDGYVKEVRGNCRSGMPLDVLGRTRATMTPRTSPRDESHVKSSIVVLRDSLLELWDSN